jgi:DNA helicase II / ATP-dependent DNA helicase PcrA
VNVTSPTFRLSPQQQRVVDWTLSGSGSAFVEAVAGAGKTTTLLALLAATKGSVAFAAYNKKIADEIKAKAVKLNLGNRVRIGTFHSFGFTAWRRVHPNVKSGPEACRQKDDMTIAKLEKNSVPKGMHSFVLKLVSLAKQACADVEWSIDDDSKWFEIVAHHDMAADLASDVPSFGETDDEQPEGVLATAIQWAKRVLRYHVALGPKIINFDDMIYLPLVSGCRMWENDWVLVDEAQDTNPARRALARKMLRHGGRSVWVGDRHQAIYGFTGADSDAIDQIVHQFSCQILPLTVTFRCPKAVVVQARTVVSHIEAHDTAPDGEVRHIDAKDLMKEGLTAADAVLCRNTKPLVDLAFQLIRNRIPCHVEGKEIGKGLLNLVNKWAVRSLDQLRNRLEDYADKQTQKLIAKGKETQAEALRDRVDTVLVLADGCQSVDDLCRRIVDMFVDGDNEQRPTLTLSTVHKSKGREWGRVFVLGDNVYMPSRWARQDWQQEQERNLMYVAYTRAQRELVFANVEVV